MRKNILCWVLLILSFSSYGQCRKEKSFQLDDSSIVTIFYGQKSKTPYDVSVYQQRLSERAIEFDSITLLNCQSLLSIKVKTARIDSVKIVREVEGAKYASVIKHKGDIQGVYTTITEGQTRFQYVYVFFPTEKKLKYHFEDNEIRSLEHYNRENDREGTQFYFSDHTLDSAYVLQNGIKNGMEYTKVVGSENVLYHQDSIRFLSAESGEDREFFDQDRAYFWLYPKLLEYNISIPTTSFLYIYVQRRRIDDEIEMEKMDR